MPLSYEDTILSRTSLVFYTRLDDPLGTTVITDLSPSGSNGTYYADAGLGIASPIETDPASTACGPGHVGTVKVDDESLNNFSWEGWVLYNGADGTLICRGGQVGLGLSNFLGVGVNSASARITITGSGMFDLVYALDIDTPLPVWLHLVVTRNGTTIRLYVNGVLRVEKTAADGVGTGSLGGFGVPTDGTNPLGLTFLGTGSSADVFAAAGSDEIAIYNAALTATEVLENYEAALNTLLSSATIKVLAQVVLDTDAPEPLNFPFAHNWTEPIGGSERVITEHLSWRTHSNQSEPDYQQRVNARPHGPRRALEYAITPTSAIARATLQRALWQPAQVFTLPVWTDWTPLTATANATDVVLACNTTLRDFEIGSSCVAFTDPYNPATYQFFKIVSRTDSQLGITPAVATTITNGLVAPARLACLPDDELQLEAYVIDRDTGAFTFEILDTELSTRRVTTYTPTTTYQPNGAKPAVEVFSLDSARFDTLEQTPYAIHQRHLGTGNLTGNDYYRGVDTATSSTIPARVLLGTRETLSQFYGWLNARQGRQNPVWVPSRENDLTLVSQVSGTVLRIQTGYAFYNLHYGRRDVQLTFTNGTVANRRITAVVDNGNGTEDITLSTSIAATVAKISWLRFCVAPDSFELRFHRDIATPGGMVVECAWEFTELLTTP